MIIKEIDNLEKIKKEYENQYQILKIKTNPTPEDIEKMATYYDEILLIDEEINRLKKIPPTVVNVEEKNYLPIIVGGLFLIYIMSKGKK